MAEETESQGHMSKTSGSWVGTSGACLWNETNTNRFSRAKPESRCGLFWDSRCKSYSGFKNFVFFSFLATFILYNVNDIPSFVQSLVPQELSSLLFKLETFIVRTKWLLNSVE